MNRRFLVPTLIGLASIGLVGRTWAQGTELHGSPISETYREQFGDCDRSDRFGGVQLPIERAGKIVWYGCRSDPSRLTRLEKIEAKGDQPEAILFEAKLALDKDGSPAACDSPGTTDQCATSLMLKPTGDLPCPAALAKREKTGPYCLPVNAGVVPYVVIPGFGPKGIDGSAFRKKTGIAVGDLGVVIAHGKVIPVIVADEGPAYKIGEGSTALLSKLSSDGKPHTINEGVQYIVFPGTSLGHNAPADTLSADVEHKATALYKRLVQTTSSGGG